MTGWFISLKNKSGMISVFFICFMFSAAQIWGQLKIDEFLSNKFEPLIKSSGKIISTGLLLDKTLSFVKPDEFDGNTFSRTCSGDEFEQIYLEIFNSYIDKPEIAGLQALKNGINEFTKKNLLPVGIIDFEYNQIRSDAFDKGLLTEIDGRLTYIKGNPFEKKSVFAATAFKEKTFRGSDVDFYFSDQFYFSNKSDKIDFMEIDFDDGFGFGNLKSGTIKIHYSSVGMKNIRIIAHFKSGSIKKASFNFNVKSLDTPQPHEIWPVTADISYLGTQAAGEAFIYRSDLNSALTNPVIIIEGFDPDNSMNWDDIYGILNQQNLIEEIRSYGYDAVVLNLDSSVTYIQRNAFLIVKLIEMVNQAAGNKPIRAIIGASMGGLLTRYALCYMESNLIDHNIEKFISFDSPQNGANIPLGLQYFGAFFASQSADGQEILDMLNSPASKQMLVYHYTDPVSSTGAPDPMFAALQNELLALGDYPQQLENVSIINGSGASQDQGYNAGDQVMLYDYNSFLVDIKGNVWAVPDNTSHIIFEGLIAFLGLPANSQNVTVNSTNPYDNCPGGYRNSFAEIASTEVEYGDIIALHENHNFIPTVSSLDADTENLFYDFSADAEKVATPFDRIYFPMENQPHITITPESAEWFLNEIVGSSAISMNEGWNLISVPLLSNHMQADSLFPSAVSSAFSYGAVYTEEEILEPGKGYWLKFPSAENFEIKGSPLNEAVDVTEGWNIIGPFNRNVPISAIETNPAGIISSQFFGYNGIYNAVDTLKPGKGYWIKTGSAGTLNFNPAGRKYYSKYNSNPKIKDPLMEIEFSFTDSNNNRRELIIGLDPDATGMSDPEFGEYPLPPFAPGNFDVRFINGEKDFTARDIRSFSSERIFSYDYKIVINPSDGENHVQFNWILPEGVSMQIKDNSGGEILNNFYSASDSLIIRNAELFNLNITLNFNSTILSLDAERLIPDKFELFQNYPNPFNPATIITYNIPDDGKVRLRIFDLLGREVATLINEFRKAGTHHIYFNSDDYRLTSGVYFYEISTEKFSRVRKMVLMK